MSTSRERLHINGIVQGVGFRPFIFRLAKQCGLSGFINNNSKGVLVEIEGQIRSIASFHQKLTKEAPPFSKIISIEKEKINTLNDSDFEIIVSDSTSEANTLISPDISICKDCLQELFDPENRRYQYPFINCTNCGPRYTIIKTIPYDRPFTSMNEFKMCTECQMEYNNPLDRRFHAQPNACPKCGPHLVITDNYGERVESNNVIEKVVQLIREGHIIAIRGLGGFHLVVDPHNNDLVAKLRERKGRQAKPFALMAGDISTIEKYCVVSEKEKESLLQPTNPIVILEAKKNTIVSKQVAPGNRYLGFMIPYTPLHRLLMQYFDILVMTSANFTDEPIAIGNEESYERLKDIADYFLVHNRKILQRCDDSIVRFMGNEQRMIRRSRGYVPAPVFIIDNTHQNILAVGGELKNTIALSRENEIFFSQHIGDLDNPAAYHFFENSIVHLKNILQIEPEVIVCDMHPEYLSSKWAKQQNLPLIEVQHHHAHLAAVLAENHINEPAIGIILDGTGYGTDGTIWGGEVLLGDTKNFERFAWLDPVPMPGGGAAIKEPWRMAYSYLKKAFKNDISVFELPLIKNMPEQDRLILDQVIDKKLNAPLTSSCGRLFDAVSAMLGICTEVSFEAQAAIDLEMLANIQESMYYDDVIKEFRSFSDNLNLDGLIKRIILDYNKHEPVPTISARFHNTISELFVHVADKARTEKKINKVALSGGVFQNMFLFETILAKLKNRKFEIITHTEIPVNDGGLALGQIVIAHNKLKK